MRSTLDKMMSWIGLALAVLLLIAGGLLTWANQFIGDQVDQQLSSQNITMPTEEALAGDEALSDADRDALRGFIGEELNNGDQARAYADHYILAHMNASSGGKTYSEISDEFRELTSNPDADPAAVEELGGLRESLFMGNTLRGLLLYGYAFATMGTIAGYAAIASFAGALLLLVLAVLGLSHARRAARDGV